MNPRITFFKFLKYSCILTCSIRVLSYRIYKLQTFFDFPSLFLKTKILDKLNHNFRYSRLHLVDINYFGRPPRIGQTHQRIRSAHTLPRRRRHRRFAPSWRHLRRHSNVLDTLLRGRRSFRPIRNNQLRRAVPEKIHARRTAAGDRRRPDTHRRGRRGGRGRSDHDRSRKDTGNHQDRLQSRRARDQTDRIGSVSV